jgi:heptosyltransferase-3
MARPTIPLNGKRIIISKINAIGDVTLCLAMAGILKSMEPSTHIIFLGRTYTRDIIEAYKHVDQFANWDEINIGNEDNTATRLSELHADIFIHVFQGKEISRIAKKANIRYRIGYSNRWYHWFTCNRRVNISRKKSELHEAQNDLKLLRPLGGQPIYSLDDIISYYEFQKMQPLRGSLKAALDQQRINLILHPKTAGQAKGYAREWPTKNFAELIRILPGEKVNIFISGSEAEGLEVRSELVEPFPHVKDITGKVSLSEFIRLIAYADGLIAASTGPVHVSAALGKHTLGLYPPMRPISAKRWGPVGRKAEFLQANKSCEACRVTYRCACMSEITPQQVAKVVMQWVDALSSQK